MTQSVPFEVLHTPTTNVVEVLSIKVANMWMTLVYKFLTEDELPIEDLATKQIIRKSSRYALINGWLYWRSAIQLWLCCIMEDE